MRPTAETMVDFAGGRRPERVCLAQRVDRQRAAAGGEQVFQQQTTKSLTDIGCMEAVVALPWPQPYEWGALRLVVVRQLRSG